jgi:hypothetical protein
VLFCFKNFAPEHSKVCTLCDFGHLQFTILLCDNSVFAFENSVFAYPKSERYYYPVHLL